MPPRRAAFETATKGSIESMDPLIVIRGVLGQLPYDVESPMTVGSEDRVPSVPQREVRPGWKLERIAWQRDAVLDDGDVDLGPNPLGERDVRTLTASNLGDRHRHAEDDEQRSRTRLDDRQSPPGPSQPWADEKEHAQTDDDPEDQPSNPTSRRVAEQDEAREAGAADRDQNRPPE
jgi:hypothetical protein